MEWITALLSWVSGLFKRASVPTDEPLRQLWQQELSAVQSRWSDALQRMQTNHSTEVVYLSKRVHDCEQKHKESDEHLDRLENKLGEIDTERKLLVREVHCLQQIVVDLGGSAMKGQVIVSLATGAIESIDYKASAILGWPQVKLVGKPLTILVPGRYRQKHDEAFEAVAKGGPVRTESIEATARTFMEHEVPILVTLSEPWETDDGAMFISADVSRR